MADGATMFKACPYCIHIVSLDGATMFKSKMESKARQNIFCTCLAFVTKGAYALFSVD